MATIIGSYYANWPRSIKNTDQWSVMATSDHLSSNKDARATDSCFSLIGPHQCGVLMVIGGWLADSVSTPSETLFVAGRGYQSKDMLHAL